MAIIIPNASSETLTGGDGRDLLFGYRGNDTLFGGAGDDYFVAGTAMWEWQPTRDFEYGETYQFGQGNDRYVGGAGEDSLDYLGVRRGVVLDMPAHTVTSGRQTDTFSSIELIRLTGHRDTVMSRRGGPAVWLEDGNDRLVAGRSGLAYSNGGEGRDTLDLRRYGRDVVLNDDELVNGNERIGVVNFEIVLGSRGHHNFITGSSDNDRIVGGRTSDSISGGAGNDRIVGGWGADQLNGGRGRDVLIGANGTDTINGGAGYDRILGGDGDDTITDTSGGARINAGTGNDHIAITGINEIDVATELLWLVYAGAGHDVINSSGYVRIDGGLGSDVFNIRNAPIGVYVGGEGNDIFNIASHAGGGLEGLVHGGAGNDRANIVGGGSFSIVYAFGSETQSISVAGSLIPTGFRWVETAAFSAGTYSLTLWSEVMISSTVASSASAVVYSNSEGQHYMGTDAEDRVFADFRTNQISRGDCVIETRGGDDYIDVSFNAHQMSILTGNGNDEIYLLTRVYLDAGAGNDRLYYDANGNGFGIDTITLGGGDDWVQISTSFDLIDLGSGNDTALIEQLPGGGHLDLGLNGRDTVTVMTDSSGELVIDHFEFARDRILTSNLETPLTLADFASVEQDGADAVLVWGGQGDFSIRLTDVSAASLTDDIFA